MNEFVNAPHPPVRRPGVLRRTGIGLCGLLVVLAACDGGGKGNVVEPAPQLLPSYNVQLFSPADRALTFTYPGGQALSLTHPPAASPGLKGTYNTATADFTVSPDSVVTFNDIGTPALYGTFTVATTAQWVVPHGGQPTAGALTVSQPPAITTVTVNGALPGVTISLDSNGDGTIDAGPVDLTWTQFDDLVAGGTAPAWQQLASFAYGSSINFLLNQIGSTVTALRSIDDSLKTTNPKVTACDRFSSAGLVAPGALPDQGARLFTWIDAAAGGDIGPGDNFSLEFDGCWQNDPADNIDDVTDGLIDFLNYTEVVQNNFITRVGFEGTTGGVRYTNLKLSETQVVPGSTTPQLTLLGTLSGAFTLVFTQP